MKTKISSKTTIGYREWIDFPELGLPPIKAKIDTGAKTSCLHAYDIEVEKEEDARYVVFKVHPHQKNKKDFIQCRALLVDRRIIKSSNGAKEERHIIETILHMGQIAIKAQLTLSNRTNMDYRMLIGRQAIRKGKCLVDVSKSYLLGEPQ